MPRFGLFNAGVVNCHAPTSVIGNARTVVGAALTSPLTRLPLSSFAPTYNNAHKSNNLGLLHVLPRYSATYIYLYFPNVDSYRVVQNETLR